MFFGAPECDIHQIWTGIVFQCCLSSSSFIKHYLFRVEERRELYQVGSADGRSPVYEVGRPGFRQSGRLFLDFTPRLL